MKAKISAITMCGMLIATGAACGFKSDLFLPGQPQQTGQYDSKNLQQLRDDKLGQLEDQANDSESIVSGEPDSSGKNSAMTSADEAVIDSSSEVPENGEVVELPTADEIIQDKTDIRKKSTDKSSSQ